MAGTALCSVKPSPREDMLVFFRESAVSIVRVKRQPFLSECTSSHAFSQKSLMMMMNIMVMMMYLHAVSAA
jgi:hypothetical protein